MGFKKAILVLLLLIILTMGAASATDTNTTSDNLAANEYSSVKLNENDNFEDKLGIDESTTPFSEVGNSNGKFADLSSSTISTTAEDIMSLTKDNCKEDKFYDDNLLALENDLNLLNTNNGTYSGLSIEIGSGGNIELNCNYYTYDSGDTIVISTPASVINGKGAVIDMAGSPSMRVFKVTVSDIIIKNMTIKNAKYMGNGGAIYFNGDGTVENCNFINNTASRNGGAICFWDEGTVTNCNFMDNHADYGGAIYFNYVGIVTNCNFMDNHADSDGGAICFDSETTSYVTNSNFFNNSALTGGAINFDQVFSTNYVTNCNFTNNKATGDYFHGGAIFFSENGNVTNCNFFNNFASIGGAIYFPHDFSTVNVTKCNFTNNNAYYGGAIFFGHNGNVINCNFLNCSAEEGGSIFWNGETGMINTSTFDYSTATSNGGAIYWDSNGGEIADSLFTNSYAKNGGAIYVSENRNVEVKSSKFENNHAEEKSGAIYGGTVDSDCTFENNTESQTETKTNISINETAVYTGNKISITTIVLSQKGGLVNTGTVEIYINSTLIATIPANTQYIHTTGEIGTYQVLAKFIDDSSYNGSSSTAEFTVIPVDIPEEIETSNDGIFTLEFPDDAEGTLTVFIDGVKYKVYDIVGGILKIDLSYKKGKYNVTFEYSGDNNYPAFKKDVNASIQTNPSIKVSTTKVLYSAGTTYKITVYKNKGILAKSVSVTIKLNNKKFKTIKTKSKGIASFKVTQKPGTYKLKITSLGTTVTKTLTVKHIVTLKAVKVKKSAKKLILQASLAKVNKKYLKKKTVTFKFNGKKYKAKTNSKGVAKVTIKSTVLKKLKAGKKITYHATYLKDTVKQNVKVKK